MLKKIKTSRWWYNFKDSTKFYFELLRAPDTHKKGDKAMEDMIAEDTKLNKMMGIPPTDKWCEKNPYRFM